MACVLPGQGYQEGWRVCVKCTQLYYGPINILCNAGGKHLEMNADDTYTSTFNISMPVVQSAQTTTGYMRKYCSTCGLLGEESSKNCIVGPTHSFGSASYNLCATMPDVKNGVFRVVDCTKCHMSCMGDTGGSGVAYNNQFGICSASGVHDFTGATQLFCTYSVVPSNMFSKYKDSSENGIIDVPYAQSTLNISGLSPPPLNYYNKPYDQFIRDESIAIRSIKNDNNVITYGYAKKGLASVILALRNNRASIDNIINDQITHYGLVKQDQLDANIKTFNNSIVDLTNRFDSVDKKLSDVTKYTRDNINDQITQFKLVKQDQLDSLASTVDSNSKKFTEATYNAKNKLDHLIQSNELNRNTYDSSMKQINQAIIDSQGLANDIKNQVLNIQKNIDTSLSVKKIYPLSDGSMTVEYNNGTAEIIKPPPIYTNIWFLAVLLIVIIMSFYLSYKVTGGDSTDVSFINVI
jgi:hypothetical protein